MGINTALTGKVGYDRSENLCEAAKRERHAKRAYKKARPAHGASIIPITREGERSMNTHLGANHQFFVKDVNDDALSKADFWIHVGQGKPYSRLP